MEVLKEAIGKHGRPASILTDRGTQFYANESEEREKGATVFERHLVENEIRHILSRVMHPTTNGKVDELLRWYNGVRPHMSLNLDVIETPSQAFIRKMPGAGTVVDEEAGEVYHAQKR